MHDTYLSANSLRAALASAGIVCRAVDVVVGSPGCNAFACVRPPGHHAGRRGCTPGCTSTGFCVINNAAVACQYARLRYGMSRLAVVDIDVHFGNGTADIMRDDPNLFFASLHMVWGEDNMANGGFYPSGAGITEVEDTYVSVGLGPAAADSPSTEDPWQPPPSGRHQQLPQQCAKGSGAWEGSGADAVPRDLRGPEGFRRALAEVIIPRLRRFDPEILVISAGFDGYICDPLGSDLGLRLADYTWATRALVLAAEADGAAAQGRVVSILEGGYDTAQETRGLAICVDKHVEDMRGLGNPGTCP